MLNVEDPSVAERVESAAPASVALLPQEAIAIPATAAVK
jgi:hypothetical protein